MEDTYSAFNWGILFLYFFSGGVWFTYFR